MIGRSWIFGWGLLTSSIALPLGAQTVSFQNTSVPVPCQAIQLVGGDFNGDHKPDLAGLCGDRIFVLIGNGDGTFQAPQTLMPNLAGNLRSLQAADFNHDGRTDLALAVMDPATAAESLYLFLSTGNGFGPPQLASNAAGILFDDAGFADLNGDGIPDIVAPYSPEGQSTLAVLLGQKGLTYGSPTLIPAVTDIVADIFTVNIVFGEFDSTGNEDVLVPTLNGTWFLAGNGDGTFKTPTLLTADQGLILLGDFNGDGKLDVALETGAMIEVFAGNGDGTFQPAVVALPSIQFGYASVGDFDGDGIADVAVIDSATETVNIFLSNAAVKMHLADQATIGTFGTTPVIADFNGDGSPDIATATQSPQVVSVLLNTTPAVPRVNAAQNAAAPSTQPVAAGGALISIFGAGFGSATPSGATTIPLPASLGGVSVTLDGTAVPLLYVSSTQINGQVPWKVAAGTASLVVTANNQPSAAFNVSVGPFSPAVFTSGNQAVAINPDNTLAAPPGSIPGATTHPAKAGEELVILCTGLGAVDSPIADGANSADKLRHTKSLPEILIAGQSAHVDFSGLSPQFVGVYQVNATVPQVKTPGTVPLQISIGTITTSDKITIAVEN